MTRKITNQGQLTKVLEEAVTKVIEEVSEKIHQRIKDNIDKYTYEYDKDQPNSVYYNDSGKPTYEFRDKAWVLGEIKKTSKTISRKIFYDGMKMSAMSGNEKTWKHGSLVSGWPRDARKSLAYYLNVYGPTSRLKIGANDRYFSKDRAPYWDITIEELFAKGEIEKWFVESSIKNGLTVVKI